MLRRLGMREAQELQNSFNTPPPGIAPAARNRSVKKVGFVVNQPKDDVGDSEVEDIEIGTGKDSTRSSSTTLADDDGDIFAQDHVQSAKGIEKRFLEGKWSASNAKLPLDMFLLRNGHQAINKRLDKTDIGKICKCESRKRKHTVLSTVMDLTTNWERVVNRQLDQCVFYEDEDENDPNFGVTLDFQPVFGYKSSVVKEILFHGHKKAQTVLSHPLMETYLIIQNNKLSKWFTASFILYFVFLLSFTGHQISIFFLRLPGQTEVFTFPSSFTNGHKWECGYGFVCVMAFSLLLLEESFQCYVFRARYLKRFDTWLRMLIFTLVIVGCAFQNNLGVLRYVAAISVPCAWIHLVFLSGFHGATISIMFLHIMHKRFLGGILLTLTVSVGCGSGFLIIAHDTTALNTQVMVKTIFRPLLMILGEYEFNDTFDTFESDLPTLIYSSILLICIAIVGSLVLVNLLLALILADITDLYHICHSKNLFRQARQVVFYEKLAKTFGISISVPETVTICAHKSCRCSNLKLRKSVQGKLMHIVHHLQQKNERPRTAGVPTMFAIDDLF